MVKIEILRTPSCPACERVEKMLDKMGVKYQVSDITKNPEVLKKRPIMTAPGIIIDGKLEFCGVPKEEELKKKLFK